MAVPVSNKFVTSTFPPIPPSLYTSITVRTAPMNAKMLTTPIPIKFNVIPDKIANVAPSAAPDEIPSIWGSAKEFLNIAWKVQPTTARAPPTREDCNILGRRTFHTITSYTCFTSSVSTILFKSGIFDNINLKLSKIPIDDDPIDAEITIKRSRKIDSTLI